MYCGFHLPVGGGTSSLSSAGGGGGGGGAGTPTGGGGGGGGGGSGADVGGGGGGGAPDRSTVDKRKIKSIRSTISMIFTYSPLPKMAQEAVEFHQFPGWVTQVHWSQQPKEQWTDPDQLHKTNHQQH